MEGKKIFQIVGYQNSGKTTLLEKIISIGTTRGIKIGTIKHHGHGGSPTLPLESKSKDTDKHRKAGAYITSVEGEGALIIQAEKETWKVEEIIHFYNHLPIDLILIEGYKKASYPKVVLIRHKDDLPLLEELENIKAVITWIPITMCDNYDIFMIQDCDLFIELFFYKIFEELS